MKLLKVLEELNGGYVLNKNPKNIKLSNIFHALDQKVKTVGCKKDSKKDAMVNQQSVLLMNYGMS